MGWIYLLIGMGFVLAGNITIKYSHGFEKMGWGIAALIIYTFANIAFGLAVKVLPLTIAYSVWTGVVAVGVILAGYFLFDEHLTPLALLLIAVILAASIGLVAITKG